MPGAEPSNSQMLASTAAVLASPSEQTTSNLPSAAEHLDLQKAAKPKPPFTHKKILDQELLDLIRGNRFPLQATLIPTRFIPMRESAAIRQCTTALTFTGSGMYTIKIPNLNKLEKLLAMPEVKSLSGGSAISRAKEGRVKKPSA